MTFKPFPILKTERLQLRKILSTDCDSILYLRSDPIVNKYRIKGNRPEQLSDAIKIIENFDTNIKDGVSIVWGITLQNRDKVIGTICLWNFSEDRKKAEVGYALSTEHQGIGYMTETLRTVLNYGFNTLNLNLIDAYTQVDNLSSIRLLTKNGFTLEPEKKDSDNPENLIFEIKNIDFKGA